LAEGAGAPAPRCDPATAETCVESVLKFTRSARTHTIKTSVVLLLANLEELLRYGAPPIGFPVNRWPI
jgi:hypothetical protein